MAKKKGPDPIRKFKRSIQKQAAGKSDKEKLDFYLHALDEPKEKKDEGTAEVNYLRDRVGYYLKRLGYDFYLTEDGKYEAVTEIALALNNEQDAKRWRNFVRKHLGKEAAAIAVIEGKKYSANPKVAKELGDELKKEFCRKYKKTKLKCGPATEKSRQGKR